MINLWFLIPWWSSIRNIRFKKGGWSQRLVWAQSKVNIFLVLTLGVWGKKLVHQLLIHWSWLDIMVFLNISTCARHTKRAVYFSLHDIQTTSIILYRIRGTSAIIKKYAQLTLFSRWKYVLKIRGTFNRLNQLHFI